MTEPHALTSYATRATAVIAAQIAGVAAGAVIWPLLARRLGPAAFSRFQSVQVFGGLLGYVVFFGLAQYSIWRFSASNNAWPVAALLLRVRALNTAVVVTLYLLVALAASRVAPDLLALWVCLVLLGNIVRQAWPDWVFISAGKAWAVSVVAGAAGLLNIGGILVLVNGARGLLGGAAAYFVSSVLGLVALAAYGRRIARRPDDAASTDHPRRAWATELRGARPYGVAVLAGQLIAYADIVLLNVFRHAGEVGVYAAGFRIVLIFQGLSSAIQSVALMAFTKMHTGDRGAEADRGLRVTVVASGMVFSAIAGALVIARGPIIHIIFGAGFRQSSHYLAVLAWMLPADAVGAVALARLSSSGRARTSARCLVAGAASCVALTAVLIPTVGVDGAAIGKLVSVATVCVLAGLHLDRNDRNLVIALGTGLPIATAGLTMVLTHGFL